MAYRDIQRALTGALESVNASTLGNLPIAYDGRDFDPTIVTGDLYLAEAYIFNDEESLDKNQLDEATGIYQIGVFRRAGASNADQLDVIDGLRDYFTHNLGIVSNSQRVVIINAGRNASRPIDGWYVIDVSIRFKTDILRN